jgi:L-asparaginase II
VRDGIGVPARRGRSPRRAEMVSGLRVRSPRGLLPRMETLVELTRSGLVESVHRVTVAVWQDGGVVAACGSPTQPAFLRSAAKPFQALASVLTGAADRFAMSAAELALACGSHGGEEFHVRTSAGLLARCGLGPEDLLCGIHTPAFAPAAEALAASGQKPGPLHNNCSGKHAAMLAACVASGWETANYIDLAHPLQQLNRRNLAAFAGLAPEAIPAAIDGCSVPTFHIPPEAAARAFAALTTASGAPGLDTAQRAGADRLLDALRERPEMIGGTERIDTDVIAVTGGRVVSKVGAEGMWCAGVRGERLGLAVQCADGASRASYATGLAVLRGLGVFDDSEWAGLSRHHDPVRRNHRGLDVGRLRVIPGGGVPVGKESGR